MRSGRLRHRVTIEHLVAGSPAQSPSGESLAEWVALATVWASIEPLRGRELYAAQQHHAEVDTRICMRYREWIAADMRVVHDSSVYNIAAVIDPEKRRRELELMVKTDLTVPPPAPVLLESSDGFLMTETGSVMLEE